MARFLILWAVVGFFLFLITPRKLLNKIIGGDRDRYFAVMAFYGVFVFIVALLDSICKKIAEKEKKIMKLIIYVKDSRVLGATPRVADKILRVAAASIVGVLRNSRVKDNIADYVIDDGKTPLSDEQVRNLVTLLSRELEVRVGKRVGPLKQLQLSKIKRMKSRMFQLKGKKK